MPHECFFSKRYWLLYFTGYTDLQKCQWPLHYRMAENCGHYTQDHNTIMLWRRVVNLIEVAKWNPLPQNSIYNTVIVFIFFVLLQDRGHQTLSNDTLVKLRTLDRNPSSASNYASQYGGGSPQVSSKICTFKSVESKYFWTVLKVIFYSVGFIQLTEREPRPQCGGWWQPLGLASCGRVCGVPPGRFRPQLRRHQGGHHGRRRWTQWVKAPQQVQACS